MARTTVTQKAVPGGYPVLQPAVNSLDFAFVAADVPNKNQAVSTGRELILVQNSDPTNPYTVTFTSIVDDLNRPGDITAYTLQATEFAVFGPFPQKGWRQSDAMLYFEGSNAAIKFAVLTLNS